MNLHVTTGRWRLGIALSSVSALMWGTAPIALKALLDQMDAYTITWYRFGFSALALLLIMRYGNRSSGLQSRKAAVITLLAVAALSLCGNYILFVTGLTYVSPSTATVVIQLATIFMLFGSMIVFRERFSLLQWTGFIIFVFGLALFFNDRLQELRNLLGNYTSGVLMIVAAAAAWALYALAQKQLLNSLSSKNIMLVIYLTGIFVFMPSAEPGTLFSLDTTGYILLIYCAFNTLIAYGSFAEALDHLDASRVSMVLATNPLITIIGMKVCTALFPGLLETESLNYLSIVGGMLVVAGSMLCVLDRRD